MANEEIVEKVRKLLAKAKSTDNENESAIFMAKVNKMLTDHDIEMSFLEAEEQDEIEEARFNMGCSGAWRQDLLCSVARLYYCEPLVYSMENSVAMVGRASNIKVAQLMGDYLIKAIKRRARDYSPVKAEQLQFRTGASINLRNRIWHILQERKESEPVSAETGNALALYQNEVKEFFKKKHPDLVTINRKGSENTVAKLAGFVEADNISLSQQITTNDGPLRLGGS